MKLTNLVVLFLIFGINNKIYSQINPPITNPKKIIFTYKITPNYHFEMDTVYADTFLLKKEFPKLKYILKKSPFDSLTILGCFNKNNLTKKDYKHLGAILSHTFSEMKYTYNVKEKSSEFQNDMCKSEECKKIFKDFFNYNNFSGGTFYGTVKYYDEKHLAVIDNQMQEIRINYKNTIVDWLDEYENTGIYTEFGNDKYLYTNIAIFDPNLDKHISPVVFFNNCKFGIRKIFSKYTTITLTSVTYE